MRELTGLGVSASELDDSAAAARLNGYAGGHCSAAEMRARLGDAEVPRDLVERIVRLL